jgi:hypothetical protein
MLGMNGTISKKRDQRTKAFAETNNNAFKLAGARKSKKKSSGKGKLSAAGVSSSASLLEDAPEEYLSAINKNQCIQQVP